MKKLLLILLCLPLLFGCGNQSSQESADDFKENTKFEKENDLLENLESKNTLVFTDGQSIEGLTKQKFINGCAEDVTKNNGGSYENNKEFCECIIEEASKNMTSLDYKDVFGNGLSNMVQNINESLLEKIMQCMKNKGLLDEAFFSPDTYTKEQWKALADNTKNNLKNSLTSEQYKDFIEAVNIDGYSECYIKKLYEKFTSEEMMNIDVTDSETLAKIQSIEDECIQQNLK